MEGLASPPRTGSWALSDVGSYAGNDKVRLPMPAARRTDWNVNVQHGSVIGTCHFHSLPCSGIHTPPTSTPPIRYFQHQMACSFAPGKCVWHHQSQDPSNTHPDSAGGSQQVLRLNSLLGGRTPGQHVGCEFYPAILQTFKSKCNF